MTPQDEAQIRAMKLPRDVIMDPDLIVTIVNRWNAGYSSKHIVEILNLPNATDVSRALASVRIKTTIVMRKVGSGCRNGTVEHPSWWTQDRLDRMRGLWEPGDLKNRDIAKRLNTNDDTVSAKVNELGWSHTRMTPKKVTGRTKVAPNNVEKAAVNHGVGKRVVWEPLPGTTPIPFWQVPLTGACNFILEDCRGSMADALCCAAETEKGQRYCPEHHKLSVNPAAWGKPVSAHALARSLRRYA